MYNAVKPIYFFLLVFAAGSAISQQNVNVAQLGNFDNSRSTSKTFCQQFTNGSISNDSAKADPLWEHASTSNANDAPPKTITSCNSLLNILPVQNKFSFNAGEQQRNIGFHNAVLSSQIFVYQEPDPPRLG